MKFNVWILERLLQEAEAAANDLRLTRGKLIQRALEEFLKRRRDEEVTAALNRSYAESPEEIDPFLQHLALEGMKRTEWKE
jgi:hypothetical protein